MMLQSEIIGDGTWALILGPYGLLVASIIVIVVLWRKLNKREKDHQDELQKIQEARHKDLVSGLKYREEIGDKLLEGNVADRVTANKMIEAMKALSNQQEKTDGNLQRVSETVQEIKTTINNQK